MQTDAPLGLRIELGLEVVQKSCTCANKMPLLTPSRLEQTCEEKKGEESTIKMIYQKQTSNGPAKKAGHGIHDDAVSKDRKVCVDIRETAQKYCHKTRQAKTRTEMLGQARNP